MAPLPGRYGDLSKANDEEEVIVTDNFLVIMSLVFGACGLILMAQSLVLKTDPIFGFADFALSLTSQTQYLRFACWGIMISGLATFIISIYGGWVSLRNLRTQMKCFLFTSLIFAFIQLAAGAFILSVLGVLNDAIYSSTGTSSDPKSFKGQVIHFQLAMYNECCYNQSYSNAKEEEVRNCEVDKPNTADQTDLSTCYSDYLTYYQYHQTVVQNQKYICGILNNVTIDVTGYLVPGTNYEVTAFTKGQKIIPLVGNYTAPTYGCGLGFAKAFQAAQFVWMDQRTKPLGNTAVACAIIQLLAIGFGFIAFTLGNVATTSGASEDAYQTYLKQMGQNNSANAHAPNKNLDILKTQSMGSQMSTNSKLDNRMSMNLPVAHAVPASFNVDDKI